MRKLLIILCCTVSMACFGQKKTTSTQTATAKPSSNASTSKSATVTTTSGSSATFSSYVYSPDGMKSVTLMGGPKNRKFKGGLYTKDGKICLCAGNDGYGHAAVAPGTEIIAECALYVGSFSSTVYIPTSVKCIGSQHGYFTATVTDDFKIIENSSDSDE